MPCVPVFFAFQVTAYKHSHKAPVGRLPLWPGIIPLMVGLIGVSLRPLSCEDECLAAYGALESSYTTEGNETAEVSPRKELPSQI